MKDILTGKGLPSPTPPDSTIQEDIENAQIGAGATQEHRIAAAQAAQLNASVQGGLAASQAALAGGGGVPGGVGGAAIAADALKYLNHLYVFGGAPGRDGKHGWDCSSFCNWVVGHDMGLSIPSFNHGSYNGAVHGPNTVSWIAWTGCKTVPHRDVEIGDLLIWRSHMGIAISKTEMVSAQGPTGTHSTLKSTIAGMAQSLRTETLVVRRLRETLLAQPAATTAKGGTSAKNKGIGKLLAARYGWSTGREWACLESGWQEESGWRINAANVPSDPFNHAYGIPQANPGSKMASAGAAWKTSASVQVKWGLKYIKDTYGSPSRVPHWSPTGPTPGYVGY